VADALLACAEADALALAAGAAGTEVDGTLSEGTALASASGPDQRFKNVVAATAPPARRTLSTGKMRRARLGRVAGAVRTLSTAALFKVSRVRALTYTGRAETPSARESSRAARGALAKRRETSRFTQPENQASNLGLSATELPTARARSLAASNGSDKISANS
jgi:hypothetical protein